jgi:hypothetical protein
MQVDKRVEFEELALAALRQLVPDESAQQWAQKSLTWYLRRDAEEQAIRCPAFEDRALYTFVFWKYRVLFEVTTDAILIWSVAPAALG